MTTHHQSLHMSCNTFLCWFLVWYGFGVLLAYLLAWGFLLLYFQFIRSVQGICRFFSWNVQISEQSEGGKGNTGNEILQSRWKELLGIYTRQIGIKGGKHVKFSSMSYVFHFTDCCSRKPETSLHATKIFVNSRLKHLSISV